RSIRGGRRRFQRGLAVGLTAIAERIESPRQITASMSHLAYPIPPAAVRIRSRHARGAECLSEQPQSKRPRLSPGPRYRAARSGGSHQMFGMMCQLMPNLACWTWRLSCSPTETGKPPPRAGSTVPLTVVVLLPKSMKSYSALIDQLFQIAHSMPVPTVQPTRSVPPRPLKKGVVKVGPGVVRVTVELSVSSR